jgi:hypothetical protein
MSSFKAHRSQLCRDVMRLITRELSLSSKSGVAQNRSGRFVSAILLA